MSLFVKNASEIRNNTSASDLLLGISTRVVKPQNSILIPLGLIVFIILNIIGIWSFKYITLSLVFLEKSFGYIIINSIYC